MKLPKINISLVVNALFIIIIGFIGKPSVPISAPANNASVILIVGEALLVLGFYCK